MSDSSLGYLVPQFPGQTHIFFWRELEALRRDGIDPVLLSTLPPPPGLISHEWSEEAMARTIYTVRMDPVAALAGLWCLPKRDILQAFKSGSREHVKDLALALPAARRLLSLARQKGITHVHAHSCGRAALIAAMAHRMGGPTYSLTLHGPLHEYGPGQRYKWQHAAFATVITRKLLDEIQSPLAGALPPVVEIQAMGVDTDRLSRPSPWRAPGPGEPIRLFSCGRLNMVKGHQDLLEAVRLLRDQGKAVHLTIAGEDDAGGTGYRGQLSARITELGLDRAVTLLGAVSESEVLRHLLDTHYFALASWHEPLGIALMEAMSCEVPTIGTAAGGVAELMTDGQDGILVPPKDPQAMVEAILRLEANPVWARQIGEAGRRRIVSKFSAATGAQTLVRLIEASGRQLSRKVVAAEKSR